MGIGREVAVLWVVLEAGAATLVAAAVRGAQGVAATLAVEGVLAAADPAIRGSV